MSQTQGMRAMRVTFKVLPAPATLPSANKESEKPRCPPATFAIPLKPSDRLARVWTAIEHRYRKCYLPPSRHDDFIIEKLQLPGGVDLELTDTVGELFGEINEPDKRIVHILQAPVDRVMDLPEESELIVGCQTRKAVANEETHLQNSVEQRHESGRSARPKDALLPQELTNGSTNISTQKPLIDPIAVLTAGDPVLPVQRARPENGELSLSHVDKERLKKQYNNLVDSTDDRKAKEHKWPNGAKTEAADVKQDRAVEREESGLAQGGPSKDPRELKQKPAHTNGEDIDAVKSQKREEKGLKRRESGLAKNDAVKDIKQTVKQSKKLAGSKENGADKSQDKLLPQRPTSKDAKDGQRRADVDEQKPVNEIKESRKKKNRESAQEANHHKPLSAVPQHSKADKENNKPSTGDSPPRSSTSAPPESQFVPRNTATQTEDTKRQKIINKQEAIRKAKEPERLAKEAQRQADVKRIESVRKYQIAKNERRKEHLRKVADIVQFHRTREASDAAEKAAMMELREEERAYLEASRNSNDVDTALTSSPPPTSDPHEAADRAFLEAQRGIPSTRVARPTPSIPSSSDATSTDDVETPTPIRKLPNGRTTQSSSDARAAQLKRTVSFSDHIQRSDDGPRSTSTVRRVPVRSGKSTPTSVLKRKPSSEVIDLGDESPASEGRSYIPIPLPKRLHVEKRFPLIQARGAPSSDRRSASGTPGDEIYISSGTDSDSSDGLEIIDVPPEVHLPRDIRNRGPLRPLTNGSAKRQDVYIKQEAAELKEIDLSDDDIAPTTEHERSSSVDSLPPPSSQPRSSPLLNVPSGIQISSTQAPRSTGHVSYNGYIPASTTVASSQARSRFPDLAELKANMERDKAAAAAKKGSWASKKDVPNGTQTQTIPAMFDKALRKQSVDETSDEESENESESSGTGSGAETSDIEL